MNAADFILEYLAEVIHHKGMATCLDCSFCPMFSECCASERESFLNGGRSENCAEFLLRVLDN